VQLEMGFNNEEAVGILSGRPWRRHFQVDEELMGETRRLVPLHFAVSDYLVGILAGRGFTNTKDLDNFFFPSLTQLHDPFLLKEMDLAVGRMMKAVEAGEKVAVHGDFDVDGITGCALLCETLSALRMGENRVHLEPGFIPDRATDGYGVAERMVRQWAADGVTLLVTVDTGAAANAEIDLAGTLGMDVIVLDHHIFEERPAAVALVNPRRDRATYPNDDLCGVAVAFKFAQALKQNDDSCLDDGFLDTVLDLVALGLVADQMAITGENRILVKKGLERFNDRAKIRVGLAALLSVAGLDRGFPVTTSDFAYQLAPRINACGRIGRVMSALELLLTKDERKARDLAAEADRTNSRRKEQDILLKGEALDMALPYVERGDCCLVLESRTWHKGIIGIGAARLVEQYQLPVILISVEGDEARGSARSVPHVDVKSALDKCSEHLMRHGGHAQAAGMTLRTRDIPAFREAFLQTLRNEPYTGPVPEGYDLDLCMDEICAQDVAKLVNEMEHLEPFGAGNRKPIFRCNNLQMQRQPTPLSGGAHLRFSFRGPATANSDETPALTREFVSFSSGDAWRRMISSEGLTSADLLDRRWDVLFQIGRSTFRPRHGHYDPVQQLLIDIKPSEPS
jgi:single-stranded-DNA-specific exonuclease